MIGTIIKPIVDAPGTTTSAVFKVDNIRYLTFTGVLTGSTTPTATVKIQTSNWAGQPNQDMSNIPTGTFEDLSGASLVFAGDLVDTSAIISSCYRFIRFVYQTSGGTAGTFNCTALLQSNA